MQTEMSKKSYAKVDNEKKLEKLRTVLRTKALSFL